MAFRANRAAINGTGDRYDYEGKHNGHALSCNGHAKAEANGPTHERNFVNGHSTADSSNCIEHELFTPNFVRKNGRTDKKPHERQGTSGMPMCVCNQQSDSATSKAENVNETEDQVRQEYPVCTACETGALNTVKNVCKTVIASKSEMSNSENTKLKKKQWMAEYLQSFLPRWLLEPEFMVHGKSKADKDSIHRQTDSLFSTSSGFTNYRGLLNLALILLVLSNARLFLENLIKYGILINPFVYLEWFLDEPYNWPNVLLILSSTAFPLFTFFTECALAKDWISDKTGTVLHVLNGIALLVYPAVVIYITHPTPVFSSFTLTLVTIMFLKHISYTHTNYWCRQHFRTGTNSRLRRRKTLSSSSDIELLTDKSADAKSTPNLIVYPKNLNLQDFCYFMCAPTLCYELNFPRSARIRKRFLVKRILEMLFLFSLMVGLVQQWIVPTVNNSLKPLSELDFFRVMERLLKLAIPNHFIWLVFFYCFFHSMLNVVAELLMFGDREFYRDWWNAETVSEFWQHWNIPVHRWATRHVYKPLLKRGWSRVFASTMVFMLSAFFHEYLVSIPLRMFKVWAFMGMLMQVPLAYFSARYMRGKWGNILVWFSLIMGQPIAILAYVHDYYILTITANNLSSTAL